MRPKLSDYKITYQDHKNWYREVFKPIEWLTRSGRDILSEARSLNEQIDTQTFIQIRKEILFEIKSDPVQMQLSSIHKLINYYISQEV